MQCKKDLFKFKLVLFQEISYIFPDNVITKLVLLFHIFLPDNNFKRTIYDINNYLIAEKYVNNITFCIVQAAHNMRPLYPSYLTSISALVLGLSLKFLTLCTSYLIVEEYTKL